MALYPMDSTGRLGVVDYENFYGDNVIILKGEKWMNKSLISLKSMMKTLQNE